MKLKGARVLLECLKEQQVDTIFGYPGGQVLPIYNELYDFPAVKHYLTAHEQGATHAADGYARATGKVGVVLVTSGPGATNTVTGIATAYMDSVPMVVITGQVPLGLLGKDSFQEVDITGITIPITKHNYIVKNPEQLANIVRDAFRIARTGRPGPVLIDIPKDIQIADIEYEPVVIDVDKQKLDCISTIFDNCICNELDEALEAIRKSEKPVIYAGGGVIRSYAHDELLIFAEKLKAPVTCSLMGHGAFPGSNPLFMGMVGMHGTRHTNYAISECDLIIAIGARFSDRVISKVERFAPEAKILHIDIDPAELGKNVNVHYALNGDVKQILCMLNHQIKEKKESSWLSKINDWKNKDLLELKDDMVGADDKVKPQYIIQKLYDITSGKAIITTEVGQNQIWAAQYYKFDEPRSYISSGGLGTMGYGLGASIGAQIGRPDKRVVNIAGDGSFRMNSTELATISKYQVPIVQIVLNNGVLGMVRQWQDLFFEKRFSSTTLGNDVDFIKLADAYGIKSIRVNSNKEVKSALELAFKHKQPFLIECIVDENEKVFPIVPPGAAIDQLIEE